MAYSRKMVGSLYVKATLFAPTLTAVRAMAAGDASDCSVSSWRAFEMSQFWQN